jgi:hypothetical protein
MFADGKVWCLRTTSERETPAGYRFLGELRQGMGGTLVPERTNSLLSDNNSHHTRVIECQRQVAPHQNGLILVERDRAIRRLHAYLGLKPEDREYLIKVRGLSLGQIARGLYFSLGLYQKLPAGLIGGQFPGACFNGTRLNNSRAGIACVLFDPSGRAIGIQLRITDDDDGGRYRWLSGEYSSHLRNGELPLTYIRPPQLKRQEPALIEGTGFKPQIAAWRLGQITIGASGGQHSSSPIQLRHNLRAAARAGGDGAKIQLYLDAGDVENPHVMSRWATLVQLLAHWGKTVEICWWGQRHKSAPDLDELEDLNSIETIPLFEFNPLLVCQECYLDHTKYRCPDQIRFAGETNKDLLSRASISKLATA